MRLVFLVVVLLLGCEPKIPRIRQEPRGSFDLICLDGWLYWQGTSYQEGYLAPALDRYSGRFRRCNSQNEWETQRNE